MPPLPGPTIPYPQASGPQACADWCASTLSAVKSHISFQASAICAMHTWLQQRQWIEDGGTMASYPLPIASGPGMPLNISGVATDVLSDTPMVTYQ